MRKVFVLMSACLVMSLVLAPSAMAQAGPEGEGPCTGTFAQYIPEVNGCVTTEGLPSRGVGQAPVFDADTGERIGTLNEVEAQIESGEAGETGQAQPPQQGPECPTNQVNVLLEDGEFICVPGGSAERTPAQEEAVLNDPRANASTPLIEKPRFCDEFYGSQASAQEFFKEVTPDDRFNLDPDNDGVACEGLLPNGQEGQEGTSATTSTSDAYSATTGQYAEDASADQYAEGAEDTGGNADTGDTGEINVLPDTGGTPLWAIGAGAGLLLAGGGLLLKRRLS